MMGKLYYPHPVHDGKHKYYVITKSGKTIKFGASGYSDFTIHKDEARKQNMLKNIRMKIGRNLELIQKAFGPAGCQLTIKESYADIKKVISNFIYEFFLKFKYQILLSLL